MLNILKHVQQSLTETQQNQVFTNWGLGSVARLDYNVITSSNTFGIIVTYPVGAVCTITNGITSYAAPDTSGSWSCTVNSGGEWTVTVVGVATVSETVRLTNGTPVKSVTLTYETSEPKFSFTCNGTTYAFNSSSSSSSVNGVYYFYKSGSNWEFYAFQNGTITVQTALNLAADIFLCGGGNPGVAKLNNTSSGGDGGARKTVRNVYLTGSVGVTVGGQSAHSYVGSYTSNGGTVSAGASQHLWTFYTGEDGGYAFDDSTAKGPDGNSRKVGPGGGHGGWSETDGALDNLTVTRTSGGSYGGGDGGASSIGGSEWWANDGENGYFYGAGGGGAGACMHTGGHSERDRLGNPGAGYQGCIGIRNKR